MGQIAPRVRRPFALVRLGFCGGGLERQVGRFYPNKWLSNSHLGGLASCGGLAFGIHLGALAVSDSDSDFLRLCENSLVAFTSLHALPWPAAVPAPTFTTSHGDPSMMYFPKASCLWHMPPTR